MINNNIHKFERGPLPHPSEIVGTVRMLRWGSLIDNGEYEFEIIGYMQSKSTKYGSGGYFNFVAKILQDYTEPDFETGEIVICSFPYNTYIKALLELPKRTKDLTNPKNLTDLDSIYLKFKKIDRMKMVIEKMAKMKPDETGTLEKVESLLEYVCVSDIYNDND